MFSVFNGSAILPSDKIKLRLLASGHYLKILILWLLISTFFNNVPVHKNEFDVPVMEYNYASQIFMNTTENFFTSTLKHSTSFHSAPNSNSVLYHSRNKQFNISFISGTFIPKPIPAIYVGYEELLNVIPVKMFTYDQFYLSIKYENKFCYPRFKYYSSDLGAADWNSTELLSARSDTFVQALLVDEWSNSLDLLNPPSRSQLTQMIYAEKDVQRFQKSSKKFLFLLFVNKYPHY